jgi:ABC-type branched-subunit amino acid transport system substrate-binding protein
MNLPAASIPFVPAGSLYYQPRSGSPTAISAFTTALRSHTGNQTEVLQKDSMFVYDSFQVIAKAIVGTGGGSGAALRNYIKSSTTSGVTGNTSFRSDGKRADQRFDVINVSPGTGTQRISILSFYYDDAGINDVNSTVIWPGATTIPTSGTVSIWPMAFVAKLPTVSEFGVPFNGTISRLFARWMMNYINDRSGFLPPNTRVSMPSIDDTGTQGGAVRLVSTFPSFGFVGIIGSDTSEISSAIQLQLSANNIPQVSHGATATLLSNKDNYPSFFRTVPADGVQTLALVRLAQVWGWSNVAVISTASIYGADLSSTFLASASREGLPVTLHVSIPEDSENWNEQVALLQEAGAHIVVILGEPVDVFKIVVAAKAISYKPRAWVAAASLFTSPYIAGELFKYEGLEMSDFNGFVGAAAGLDINNPTYLSFKQNLSNPTFGASAELIRQCNIVPLYCAYIYDSVFTMAHAIKNLVQTPGGNPRDGLAMLNAIRQVDVELTTGRVHFDENQDRIDGQFSILNFISGQVTQVGTWSERTGAAFSRSVVWPDGSTNIPAASDPPTINWLQWNSAAGIVLAVLAAVGIFFTLLVGIVVFYQSQSPIIHTATWEFLIVILLGIGLGYGSMFTWIGEPRPWICALRIWLPPIAFAMIMAPLLAKTWRLHKIFTLGSLKLVPIPFWKLSIIAFAIFLVQVIICIIWISIGTIQPALVVDKNAKNTYDKVCSQKENNRILSYVTYGYCAFIVFAGAYLAFVVRKLPKDFNESRWIGFSMYNTILFGILIIVLGFSLADFRRTVLILICAATLAISTGVLIFMYLPKIWDLWRHPEKRSGSGKTRKTTSGSGIAEETSSRRHNYSRKPNHKTSSAELSTFEDNKRSKGSSEMPEPNGTTHRRHDYSLPSKSGISSNGNSKKK